MTDLTLYRCEALSAKILPSQCERNRTRYRKAMKHAKDRYRATDSIEVIRLKVCDTCPGVKALGGKASKADTTVNSENPEKRPLRKKIAPKMRVGKRRLSQAPNTKRREESVPRKQTHCSICGAELRRGPTGNPWCPDAKKHPGRKKKAEPKAATPVQPIRETAPPPPTELPGSRTASHALEHAKEALRSQRDEFLARARKLDAALDALEGV